MKFTLSWLKKFLDTDADLQKIAHTLTMTGLEVEEIIDRSETLKDFEVAEITDTKPHPDADKLQICSVQTKSGALQIVCGAANARAGIKVALAQPGTLIPNGNFKIKKSKIRGVESSGMMCSYEELGLSGDSSGIIELSDSANIGDNVAKYLGADDPVIEINITPNRADALGVYGIARDLAASGIGVLKKLEDIKLSNDFKTDYSAKIEAIGDCSLFTMRELKGLDNTKSPQWLVNALEAIGVGSISPIVDVTNYISYSFGQPMHAYDADKLKDNLTISNLSEDTKFKALDEKEYLVPKNSLVISDENGIQCLAGIMGAAGSACDLETKRIILEAAHFASDKIALTGRKIGIESDSRYRFERNVDKKFTQKALDIASSMILEICGGQSSNAFIAGDDDMKEKIIEFSAKYLQAKTSLELSNDEIIDILTKLGFEALLAEESAAQGCHKDESLSASTSRNDDKQFANLKIKVPSWRYDVTIKEDIVEEIARIYGYDKIPMQELPPSNNIKIIPKEQRRISDIKRLLASLGHTELVTWSFMDSEKAKLFSELKDELTLQNPISADLDYMRPSILPNILKICSNNINRSFKDLAFFELGPIFEDASENVVNHVCGVRSGKTCAKNSHESQRDYDVFDIKSDFAEVLALAGLELNKCQISQDDAPSYYHPTRSAQVKLGKNLLGYFGQIHPSILQKYGIDQAIYAFELNIGKLPLGKDKFGKRPDYKISNYQMIVRDYAFIVDANIAVGDMLNFIQNTDKKLIKNVSLFDVYQGEHIEQGKKSVALSVNIQDDNKTLEEPDINSINDKIIAGIADKFNGTLREV